MLRRITYRHVGNAFIFLGLWFVMGGLLLWSPLPGWLGIGGEMFVVWFVLFFLILSVAGGFLAMAALNVAFPHRTTRQQRRQAAAAAPPRTQQGPSAAQQRPVRPQQRG